MLIRLCELLAGQLRKRGSIPGGKDKRFFSSQKHPRQIVETPSLLAYSYRGIFLGAKAAGT